MTVAGITEGARAVIAGLELLGPACAALALATVARLLLGSGRAGRTRFRLAHRGLSASNAPMRRWVSLLVIPIVGMAALDVALAIEQEIRLGPQRAIDAIDPSNGSASWVLQRGSKHLMNDSRLPAADVAQLLQDAAVEGLPAQAFRAVLAEVEHDGRSLSGLIVAVPDGSSAAAAARGGTGSASSVLTDDADGFELGEPLSIRGQPFVVTGHSSVKRSLLNRVVLSVSPAGFERIEPQGSYYGVIVLADRASTQQLVARAGLADAAEVRSGAELREANEAFWAGNGTPLLLILVLLITAFGAVSAYATQAAEQEHHRRQLGTLLAIGASRAQVLETAIGGTLWRVVLGTPIAATLALVVVAGANHAIVGFDARLSMAHVATGSGVFAAGATVALAPLERQLRRVPLTRQLA